MSRFDELLDDLMFKARSVADVAGKKTGEVVELSKLKYLIKQLDWDIEKAYAKLGAIAYESKKSTENFDEIISLAVGEIDELKAKQEDLEKRLRAVKQVVKCESCGKENELNARFCVRCGAALEEEKQEAEEVREEAKEETKEEAPPEE